MSHKYMDIHQQGNGYFTNIRHKRESKYAGDILFN